MLSVFIVSYGIAKCIKDKVKTNGKCYCAKIRWNICKVEVLPGCFEVAQYIGLLPPLLQTKKEKNIYFEKNLEHILRAGP